MEHRSHQLTHKNVSKKHLYLGLLILPLALLSLSFYYASPLEIINGLKKGVFWHNRLLSDSFEIMGIGPTLFNAGFLGLLSVLLIMYLNLKPNGIIFVATTLVIGFSFLGKNPLNVFPIVLGTFLYSHYRGIAFKQVAVVALLGTTLAPVISSLALLSSHVIWGILLALAVGIAIGFFLPMISTHVVIAHHGYSLYNMGFAAGLLAMLIHSLLKAKGIHLETVFHLSHDFSYPLFLSLMCIFILYIFLGFYANQKTLEGFSLLHKQHGRLVSDFTHSIGYPVSIMNTGILGLLCLTLAYIFQSLNGPVLCGLFSVIAFASFGKHIKNVLPIMLGIFLASLWIDRPVHPSVLLMTMFLGTSLAPIAGEFGAFSGVVTGFLHLHLVLNFSNLHGGITLYNNGLAAGILAMVLVPCIQLVKGDFE